MKPVKIVLVGDAEMGKTKACSKLIGSSKGARTPYAPTVGADVHQFTNLLGIDIIIWDCAGDERFSGNNDNYYINADICVIFGENQYKWAREVQAVSDNIIIYPFSTMSDFRKLVDSIVDGSPKGHVTDEEITVINVLSNTNVA